MTDHMSVASESAGVLVIELNRPEKKNALTTAMYAGISDALHEASARDDIGVVLLRSSSACFTAGNDLEDFADPTPAGQEIVRFLMTLARFEKPLVASVRGLAIGVGTTLLLHCDLVHADETATFAMPFTALGLVPEAGSSYLLPRMVGQRHAAELLLLGERFDAHRAREVGLVNQVHAVEDLDEVVGNVVGRLARLPRGALLATRKLMKEHDGDRVARAIQAEVDVFLERLQSDEFHAALEAFRTRRT